MTALSELCYVQNMNVHNLNNKKNENQDSYKSLLLLDEISKGEPLSQRDLSKKLNLALGLVNSYIKNLISKGYITIKDIPSKRYSYYLTPKGFAEKSRLTYYLLHDYTRIFREARKDFRRLFRKLLDNDIRSVVFAGVDEVAEIAYLSLQEVGMELITVLDDEQQKKKFFNHTVRPLEDLMSVDFECIVITSFFKKKEIYSRLLDMEVMEEKIFFQGEI